MKGYTKSQKKKLRELAGIANERELDQEIKKLHQIIGDIIVGMEERETIELIIHRLMVDNDLTLSTAESCTGGNIAKMITSVAGASQFFKGSIVAYSAKVKHDILEAGHSSTSISVALGLSLANKKLGKDKLAITLPLKNGADVVAVASTLEAPPGPGEVARNTIGLF